MEARGPHLRGVVPAKKRLNKELTGPLTPPFPDSSGICASLLQDECLTSSSGGGCQPLHTLVLYIFSGSPLSQPESLF